MPAGCQVGGSGVAAGLGKVRVYSSVRLGLPRPGGCREATATATFSGALPAPPAAMAARDPAARVDSDGCGRRPPARPGRSVDLDDVSGLSELGDRRGFLAVYPHGSAVGAGRSFWAGAGRVEAGVDDLRFIADLLDDLQGRLCVDPARVAAAGFSAGGGVAALVACDLAGRVASVATISGALYTEPGECRPSRPVPVLAIHGTNDTVVPYGGRRPTVEWPLPMLPMPTWLAEWATRDGCPGDAAEVAHYRINGGGHQAPRAIAGRPVAQVVWGFFAAHPLPG